MVKSGENGGASGSVAPFLNKCYDMIEDHSTDYIISWTKGGLTFLISDITQFSLTLLPSYFKHNNFSSFIRQLNIYGFRKVDSDRWEFANDNFIRGQKHLLKNIRRRKHPHTVDQQKVLPQQDSCDEGSQEALNHGLWKEVENLKSNKNSLMQELVKLRDHQESAESKLLLLTDRLQGMEEHQQQMLSFLVMVVQSPGFMVQLLHPKENNRLLAESGNILDQGIQDAKPVASDGMIIKYKPPVGEKLNPVVPPSAVFDSQPEPDLSMDGLKDLCISSEFLKVLMDEKMPPLENHSQFLLPDLLDDGSWEQLFIGGPFLGNIDDDSNEEKEAPTANGMEIEPTSCDAQNEKSQSFESLMIEMEKAETALELCGDEVHSEGAQNLECLTEQMELLASELTTKRGGSNNA